jgi:7,8-dihydropterin-6-yl-methyl-4-(beta-D-ribofuranosyl)aminobenzene 5'-phosphate synthase
MKITVLIENSRSAESGRLKTQHGLCLLVETGKQKFLCDTGASALFVHNAARLGLSPADCEFAVITHGHSDHGGGTGAYLKLNPAARIYLKRGAFDAHYVRMFGIFRKYIGLDRSLLDRYPENFSFIGSSKEVVPDIHILTDVLANYPRPVGNKNLLRKDSGIMTPDTFRHELIVVVRESDGLVVFTGCSHQGILNMIDTVEAHFLGETIKAVFGGFHFMHPVTKKMTEEREQVARVGGALCCKAHLKKVYTGHCTGNTAYTILKEHMGKKLDRFATGSVIEV